MANVKIAVGGEFFDRIRQNGSYYVDKTELLYEMVQETDNFVTLFTRPRRFGKTLMMFTVPGTVNRGIFCARLKERMVIRL